VALGCASASHAQAPAEGAIHVGVSLSVTGPDARWGTPMLQAVELAIEDVNRRGGAGCRPLELLVRDSATPGLDTRGRQQAVARQYAELIADPAVVAVMPPVEPSSSSGGSGRTSSPSATWPTGTSCSG
jgi:branched-chain amino acid transport system substrate-binding protein